MTDNDRVRVRTAWTAAWSILVLLCAGCGTVIAGQPSPGDDLTTTTVSPAFVHGTDGGGTDRLAATIVTDVQGFWRQTFPAAFGRPWTDLTGGLYSVDPGNASAAVPPCADRVFEVSGNAYYCPSADAVVWDRIALLPVLREQFGDGAVALVLAHEVGHAVQHRLGLTAETEAANPAAYPTILLESMADCYAGAFFRWAVDGHAPHLRLTAAARDAALSTLVTFRDPIGSTASSGDAHGDAFDRVSAFSDGYQQGATLCAGMNAHNRQFTLGELSGSANTVPANQTLPAAIDAMLPNASQYFGGLVAGSGHQWRAPNPRRTGAPAGCPDPGSAAQGPVVFCARTNEMDVATQGRLTAIHLNLGGPATDTLIASRYALAALVAAGQPTSGRSVLCLVGAYTNQRVHGATLSVGDLDAVVQVLLDYDYASRDGTGLPIGTGFDRMTAFRTGFIGGSSACGLAQVSH
jgi:predicted metalloprotease